MIFANKCDVINSLSVDDIKAALNIHYRDRNWTVIRCSGKTGIGLEVRLSTFNLHYFCYFGTFLNIYFFVVNLIWIISLIFSGWHEILDDSAKDHSLIHDLIILPFFTCSFISFLFCMSNFTVISKPKIYFKLNFFFRILFEFFYSREIEYAACRSRSLIMMGLVLHL